MDSPDMPRRLGPMLVQRRTFLAAYQRDPARARSLLPDLDRLLSDDRRAIVSFARRAARDPLWGREHGAELADLRQMDGRLGTLRAAAKVE